CAGLATYWASVTPSQLTASGSQGRLPRAAAWPAPTATSTSPARIKSAQRKKKGTGSSCETRDLLKPNARALLRAVGLTGAPARCAAEARISAGGQPSGFLNIRARLQQPTLGARRVPAR